MVFSFLFKVGSMIVGALMPAFFNYKAERENDRQLQTFYNKYWTVYACLNAAETIADMFYLTYLIPGYHLGKFVFLAWAASPFTSGGQIIYDKAIAPLFHEYQPELDSVMGRLGTVTMNAARRVFTHAASRAVQSLSTLSLAPPRSVTVSQSVMSVSSVFRSIQTNQPLLQAAPYTHNVPEEEFNNSLVSEPAGDAHMLVTYVNDVAHDDAAKNYDMSRVKEEPLDYDDDVEFVAHYSKIQTQTRETRGGRKRSTASSRAVTLAEDSQNSDNDDDVDYVVPVVAKGTRGRPRAAKATVLPTTSGRLPRKQGTTTKPRGGKAKTVVVEA